MKNQKPRIKELPHNVVREISPLLHQLDQIRLQLFRLIGESKIPDNGIRAFEEIRKCTHILAENVQQMLVEQEIDRRVMMRQVANERRNNESNRT